jgi:hypothetical protein
MVTITPTAPIGLANLSNSSQRSWAYTATSNAATLPSITSSSLFRLGGTFPIIGLKVQ